MNVSMENINDINDLIKFYEQIPENKWCCYNFKAYMDKELKEENCVRCAIGHLGVDKSSDLETKGIRKKLKQIGIETNHLEMPVLAFINDGNGYYKNRITLIEKYGNHPKERVLNYLRELNESRKTAHSS